MKMRPKQISNAPQYPPFLHVLLFIFLFSGCSGVYEAVAPEEKRIVAMYLTPDFLRQDSGAQRLDAFIDFADADALITQIDPGSGLEVVGSELGDCGEGAALPAALQGREVFQLCLTISPVNPVVGQRLIELEVEGSEEAVLGLGTFFILRALP